MDNLSGTKKGIYVVARFGGVNSPWKSLPLIRPICKTLLTYEYHVSILPAAHSFSHFSDLSARAIWEQLRLTFSRGQLDVY